MKKIISLIMVVAALCSFSTVSFAANEAPFSLTPADTTVALGDGTSDIDVTFAVTIDEEVTLSMFAAQLVYDSANVTVKSMDTTALEAVMALSAGATAKDTGLITFMNDDATTVYTVPAGTYNIPMVLTVNNTAEATYTITFDENTMIVADDWATPVNDCATYPTATITVAEAAPSKTDVVIAAPAVQKSEEANGVYNAGFLADFTVDADANNAVKAVKFTVNNGSDNAETTVELGTTVEAGTVKVALNILNVTAGVELTTTVAPIAE